MFVSCFRGVQSTFLAPMQDANLSKCRNGPPTHNRLKRKDIPPPMVSVPCFFHVAQRVSSATPTRGGRRNRRTWRASALIKHNMLNATAALFALVLHSLATLLCMGNIAYQQRLNHCGERAKGTLPHKLKPVFARSAGPVPISGPVKDRLRPVPDRS